MTSLPRIDDYPARLSFRFCPLCATPLIRRRGGEREQLVCPADGWTHYPMPYLAATVVIEHAGGVVLLRRAIAPDVGIWHLPIGHLEFGEPPAAAALRLAKLAQASGLDGVVCSAQEAVLLKRECGTDFCLVTPGIRLAGGANDDQQRVMTPAKAITAGADYLVIGRPVTQAADPVAVLAAINRELDGLRKA